MIGDREVVFSLLRMLGTVAGYTSVALSIVLGCSGFLFTALGLLALGVVLLYLTRE